MAIDLCLGVGEGGELGGPTGGLVAGGLVASECGTALAQAPAPAGLQGCPKNATARVSFAQDQTQHRDAPSSRSRAKALPSLGGPTLGAQGGESSEVCAGLGCRALSVT